MRRPRQGISGAAVCPNQTRSERIPIIISLFKVTLFAVIGPGSASPSQSFTKTFPDTSAIGNISSDTSWVSDKLHQSTILTTLASTSLWNGWSNLPRALWANTGSGSLTSTDNIPILDCQPPLVIVKRYRKANCRLNQSKSASLRSAFR